MAGVALAANSSSVSREAFGRLPDGTAVERLRLRGASGFEARIITYGAALQALFVRDRRGFLADVVLGHDDLAGYVEHRGFFGATVGRYANRIAGGSFVLDGESFQLAANDGTNALHGGLVGFDRQAWSIAALGERPAPFVTLSRVSPHGEEGYPGMLTTSVTFSLSGETELSIAYSATTDRPTIVNLTNHSFFNLCGIDAGSQILEHRLSIAAEQYLPVDAQAIPLGGASPVAGTPFDFRQPRAIGARIRDDHEQILRGRGYDHSFWLRDARAATPQLAARLEDPASGRVLELLTDQPGLQFYSGNFLDGSRRGKQGRALRQSDALCLEPQFHPDTPNRPSYPSARLDPGQTYRHHTLYRFSTV